MNTLMTDLRSQIQVPREERLIVALDVADPAEARALVEQLGDSVRFYKVGMELFMAGGYFELIDWLGEKGKKVFVDLKFFDVPETVRSAIRALAKRKVAFATIHGNQAIMAWVSSATSGSWCCRVPAAHWKPVATASFRPAWRRR